MVENAMVEMWKSCQLIILKLCYIRKNSQAETEAAKTHNQTLTLITKKLTGYQQPPCPQ